VKGLHRDRHLSIELVGKFVSHLGLDRREAEYFRHLVAFTKAKSASEIRTHFEKLQSLRTIKTEIVPDSGAIFFSDWRYPALRALLSFHDFDGNWSSLGKRLSPAITAKEAREGVDTLVRLGHLVPKDSGGWNIAVPFLTSGDAWKAEAIRTFQIQTLQLAQESIARHPLEWRDISTLTLSVPKSGISAIKDRIKDFRQEILKMVKEMDDPSTVVQFNVQLFPLTELDEESA
jgi:uncharacterized protein (TIGR02147 family)